MKNKILFLLLLFFISCSKPGYRALNFSDWEYYNDSKVTNADNDGYYFQIDGEPGYWSFTKDHIYFMQQVPGSKWYWCLANVNYLGNEADIWWHSGESEVMKLFEDSANYYLLSDSVRVISKSQ